MIDMRNMAILVVDDMKSMRSIIKKTLRQLGIGGGIYFAENGKAGLKVLRDRKVDLAIVDWRMPVMNGVQMLDGIRSDIRLRDMPVLMITAECERDIVYEVAEIEVDGYLIKPLTPAMLESKLRQAVEKTNHPDEATLFARKARDMEEAGKLEIAISCQERAVKAKPKASRLKRNLGRLYGRAGEVGAMEKCFLEAAASNLQDAVTRHLLSEFYWKKKEWTRSVRYICEALALTSRYNENAVEMGRKLLEMRQNELAAGLYSTLIKKIEKNLPLKEQILDLCMANGEYRFARTLMAHLLKEFPTSYGLLYKAGLVFEGLGEDDRALEYFMAADRQNIEPLNSKLKLAQLYCRQKKVLQADELISQILTIEPEHQAALEIRRSI